jgi:hypothetical protein
MRLLLSGRQATGSKRTTSDSDSTVAATTNTGSPAGKDGVSRGDQPLDRTANEFK